MVSPLTSRHGCRTVPVNMQPASNQADGVLRSALPALQRQMLWVSAGNIGSKLLMFVANIWIANRILEVAFGNVSVAFSIVNYVSLALFTGIDTHTTRTAAAGGPEQMRDAAGDVLLLRTLLVPLALVLSLAAAMVLPGAARWLTALFALSFLPQIIYCTNLFYGVEWVWPITVYFIGGRIVYLALLLAFVRTPGDAAWVPIAFGVAILLENAFLWLVWLRRFGVAVHTQVRACVLRWGAALPTTAAVALLLLHENAAVMALFILRGSAATGVYSAGFRLVYVAVSLSMLLSFVFLARLTRLAGKDPVSIRPFFRRCIGLAVAGGVVAALLGTAVARPLVQFLYKPVYAASACIITCLVWQMAAAPARITAFQALNACGRQKRALAVIVIGVTLSLVAIVLGCLWAGAVGAAWGTVIGEIILMIGLVTAADRAAALPREQ